MSSLPSQPPVRTVQLAIAGLSSYVADPTPIADWAESFQIPDRKDPSKFLDGPMVEKVLGVRSKSWAPEVFQNQEVVTQVAREALANAQVSARQVDAVLVVTCSPYQVLLDQDAFYFLKSLQIPDSVVPLQLGAGCAGMARAMQLATQLAAENILIVAYSLSSLYTQTPLYKQNPVHPLGRSLWMSSALFSDGASAVLLRKTGYRGGLAFYSRDSLAFGAEGGFDDPLIHYMGGGALNPPGQENSEELSCFGMAGDRVKEYYMKGMLLNHQTLLQNRPNYLTEVRKIYTHQASPVLTNGFLNHLMESCAIPRSKFGVNVETYGNLVATSTVKLLHDDMTSGAAQTGDEICISVVGAGPERGAFITRLA
ncbi:3-oxoacyl-[acyl-carrier-protein] synthase III C-terminal domain-containing protein [Larkinella bovis]|uniref:3-oxoacyl-[acyl-carrier-protein] synthase III C-terminal domain-containing protein n=1 Tax=Larkinella bovis TaxID=683041 RepID=A0ABW0I990_9BACT